MFGLNPLELMLCIVVILLLFGGKRVANLGTGLGRGCANFRRQYREGRAIDITPKRPKDM